MTTASFELGLWISAVPLLLIAATLTWLLSVPLRNAGIADSLWSLMVFAAAVVYALGSDPRAPRLSLVLWMCAIWAARLAWHFARRQAAGGEPRFYAAMRLRQAPHFTLKSLYRVFWPRALAAWIASLPLMGAFASIRPLGWLDGAGVLLWMVGIVIAVGANWQLKRFAADPAHASGVLSDGLWRYSRHPDHFGECCVAWGFYLMALAAGAWWTLPSPLLLTWHLVRISRAATGDETRGNRRPQYADYVLKTNAFFPARPRK